VIAAVSACTPVGVVAGIGATVGAATIDERGLAGTADDTRIRAEINGAWAGDSLSAYTGVGLMVHEGRVVLTGTVDNLTLQNKAVSLARGVDGGKVVYDHIHINPDSGIGNYAEDSRIVAKMRRAIFFDTDIISLNYNLDASAHTLFIQGIAQSQDEKQRVLAHARDISGVRNIVDYIRIKDPEPIKKPDEEEKPKS